MPQFPPAFQKFRTIENRAFWWKKHVTNHGSKTKNGQKMKSMDFRSLRRKRWNFMVPPVNMVHRLWINRLSIIAFFEHFPWKSFYDPKLKHPRESISPIVKTFEPVRLKSKVFFASLKRETNRINGNVSFLFKSVLDTGKFLSNIGQRWLWKTW